MEVYGSDVLCRAGAGAAARELRLPLSDALDLMTAWSRRYGGAVLARDEGAVFAVGREMADWLDRDGWLTAWASGGGARELEVFSRTAQPTEAEAALLDLPWEVLATRDGFLAAEPAQPLVVWRRLGSPAEARPAVPENGDVAVLFMAAAPEGQHLLDFEAEEAAILEATCRLPLALAVEESGSLAGLEVRLGTDGPFEALHLSCHGEIVKGQGPVLALEDAVGALDKVPLPDFTGQLADQLPPLVFLSACRSAEDEGMEPFARALARGGDGNVVGWDGSVNDGDAILFASVFYRRLAEAKTVPQAAAAGRLAVLQAHRTDPQRGRDWHLARVYLGRHGGGPLCRKGGETRALARDAGDREFLVKTAAGVVPVAGSRTFVGRRRAIQTVLRVFAEGKTAGVLVHGMGNLGKSSLAHRVVQRLAPRHRAVVIFGRYDALTIFDAVTEAVPVAAREESVLRWREAVARSAAKLADALEAMLTGPLARHPVLLVIDDLERILDIPAPGQERTPVQDLYRDPLAAVIMAFDRGGGASRLLLTSRYRFTLPDGKGGDWERRLFPLQLRPMDERERAKQWRAAQTVGGVAEETAAAVAARALAAAAGNPGLQEILCRPLLCGEGTLAEQAVAAVEAYRQSGEMPAEDNAAQEFFRRVSFDIYRNALTSTEANALRAAGLFSEGIPLPRPALAAVAKAAGVVNPEPVLDRLLGLGLLDDWGEINGIPQAAPNPLARPLGGGELSPGDQAHLAGAAMTVLAELWRDDEGDIVIDPRGVEAARLALLASAPSPVIDATTLAAMRYLFSVQHQALAALAVFDLALSRLEAAGSELSLKLLMAAAQCAARIGENDRRLALLTRGLSQTDGDPVLLAQVAVLHAEATLATDGPEVALARLARAAEQLGEAGDVRSRAVTMGKIADILQARGELDAALKIRQEEELPVYDRLGDVRSRR
ncbi:CHAT domain-containing protein, partial [Phaeospirillum tilakii]